MTLYYYSYYFCRVDSINGKTNMKIRTLLVIAISLAFCSAALAQARATGHVLAEVVESADVSFTGETEFIISKKEKKFLSLGQLTLTSKPGLLCCYTISDAEVRDIRGENYQIPTRTTTADRIFSAGDNGVQSLEVSAYTGQLPTGINYSGNYSLILSYY